MEMQIDYRNGKYQGGYEQEDRNGYGIFIDDDLSFYASCWKDGKINDDTVIYISHGKYIYGRWEDNQPHGLNVFRIGDTVVLGEFENGYLGKKVLIIFEKFNFLAILEQIEGDWAVVQRGLLRSYNDLVQYIEEANLPMQPQYFSLTKFLTYISNQSIKAVPCHGSQNCYFGYEQGLGIAFNSNNGVVSVGYHEDERVTQFGAKYEESSITEGNFKTKETIRYCGVRPKTQINSLFQKIHKRSLNFKNQYFDSKIKLLHNVEELIRNKIQQIVHQINNKDCENTFTALDLNDSLDYHAESLDEINKIHLIREAVYEQVHIPFKKTVSQYVEASPVKKTKRIVENQKNQGPIINAPSSPTNGRKSQVKLKEKELEKSKAKEKQPTRAPSRKQENISRTQTYNFCQDTFGKNDYPSPKTQKANFSGYEFKNTNQIKNLAVQPEARDRRNMPYFAYEKQDSEYFDIKPRIEQFAHQYQASYAIEEQPSFAPTFKYSNSEQTRNLPSFAPVTSNKQRENADHNTKFDTPATTNYKHHELSKSPVKGPSYENISQRRKRLVKEFKNLNNGNEAQNSASSVITRILRSASKSNISSSSRNSSVYPNSYNDVQPQKVKAFAEYDSPCVRQKLDIYESKNTEQSQTILPLTITKNSNLSYALGPSSKQPIISRQKFSQAQKFVPQSTSKYDINKLLKQNVESEIAEQKNFERKQSYQDRLQNSSKQPQGQTKVTNLSGGIKKSYKYYFEQ